MKSSVAFFYLLACCPGEAGTPPSMRFRDHKHAFTRFPAIRRNPDYNVGIAWEDAKTVGDLESITKASDGTFEILCKSNDSIRVKFFREDVVRVWLGLGKHFTDNVSIVIAQPLASLSPTFQDEGHYLELMAAPNSSIVMQVTKSPLRFSMYRKGTLVWREAESLSYNSTATFQTLLTNDDEHFFGGGMQNGRFSHKGTRVRVSTDGNWDEGGNPNAAPFWLSSGGYGVYRNTWKPGYYDFSKTPGVFAHNESRFDAFYIVAEKRDFRSVLEGYTWITGRPFMPPIYGLGLGDSDCYHNDRHGMNTEVAISIAEKYRQMDIPGAWILPNDGYGCGYGQGPEKFPHDFKTLDKVGDELHKRGFEMGLWSSTGLPNIAREVNESGVRIGKTDVGWIGDGYKYAFESCELVADGIEKNSDGRRFIWTVEGWAGTQRLAVMWTGDDYGTWDYIRWQIPTFIGCGFSAQAHVSGDIDGIFGGSPETYVRDLQMKSMTTVLMTMSGWAANPDKQPWTWGEPYTSINRMYLKMKMRLTPYMYSLSREAHDTGFPPIRATVLEFPDDDFTMDTRTSQQFMSGPFFLVAPVFQPLSASRVRDNIYLPAGDWIDYWDHSITSGPITVQGYDAPLEKLPMFVRAGAIIPMWPDMAYPGEKLADPLTVEIFPAGQTNFELYEDDGMTREALEGRRFSKTLISCEAAATALKTGGQVQVIVGASVGDFTGKLQSRSYEFRVHAPKQPKGVEVIAGRTNFTLEQVSSLSELDSKASGWFFRHDLVTEAKLSGLVVVKTFNLSTSDPFVVILQGEPPRQHILMGNCNRGAAFDYDNLTHQILLRQGSNQCLTVGDDKDGESGTPALEMQPCQTKPQQQWTIESNGNFHLRGDPQKCIDYDRRDKHAEMYPCGVPVQANQVWKLDGETGKIVSAMDKLCFSLTWNDIRDASMDLFYRGFYV